MIRDQFLLDLNSELIVDNFAGGGGASTGIELALGRHVDIAINHDPEAVAMHSINHPQTDHHCESVWDVDPLAVTQGRPVGLAWFSPDCKHFSKAKGSKPRDKRIRGLAWIVHRWAALVRPRVIMLENVEEFQTWGPLLKDGKPCPARKGKTFKSFVHQLQEKGYAVEWRELRACDFGAPTIRKRLFMIARCDGRPIVWPAPTHAAPDSPAVKSGKLKPWRTAAECIDWSIPCPSIFERTRPLAEATLRRIARGIQRYVIDSASPFVVTAAHGEGKPGAAKRWGTGVRTADLPLPTITASGGYAVAAPFLTEHANGSAQRNFAADQPLRTQCAEVKGGHFAVACANLIKHYGGNYDGSGISVTDPLHTVTTTDHHALTTSNLVKLRGTSTAQATDAPAPTITAGGTHIGEVRVFLVKYYGEGGQDSSLHDPMHTVPTKDRMGLVTVHGETYAIADIGMRMLEPPELYAANGFPSSYIIAPVINGKRLPKHAQVRMCGNSVCPPLAQALVSANVPEMAAFSRKELKERIAA